MCLVGLFGFAAVLPSVAASPVRFASSAASSGETPNGALYGVLALSPDDVWAVGETNSSAFAKHWDGTGWKPVPTGGSWYSSRLTGISGVAPDDIWAVGWYTNASGEFGFADHWDGTTWTPVTLPGGKAPEFTSISMDAPHDAWAASTGGFQGGVVDHWNGTTWQQVATPDVTAGEFNAIVALSPTDVWAVGEQGEHQGTLTEHWDGTTFGVVDSPDPSRRSDALNAVTATASDNVVAVGLRGGPGQPNETVKPQPMRPLIERWNGTTWVWVRTHQPKTRSFLYGITSTSPDACGPSAATSRGPPGKKSRCTAT